jgi:DNA-binding IclR family transcriptional regulator
LAIVARGNGPTQTELAEETRLSAPNVSRLLRILEDHDLIERRKVGQAKRVYPTAAAVYSTANAANEPGPLRSAPASNMAPLEAALREREIRLDPIQAGLHQAA